MAENLKDLREQRNELLSAGKAIIAKASKEERSLNEEEIRSLNDQKAEIETIETSMKAIKEFRSKNKNPESTKIENRNSKEENKVAEDKKEIRSAMNAYLRNGNKKEIRDVAPSLADGNADENAAGNGGVIVPTDVYNDIIKKLDEEAPVFEQSRKFPSATGSLKVPREKSLAEAGFVGEGIDVSKLTPQLGTVKLNGHRVGANIQLTNEMLNDTGINLVNYSTDYLSRSLGRALQRAILLGAVDGQEADETFSPVIGDKDIKQVQFAGETPTVDEMIDLITGLNPAYLNGASLIVSRDMFNAIAKLKDGDGAYLLFKTIVGDRPGYQFQQVPVYVADVLNGAKQQVILGNFGQGYGVMVKQGMQLIHVTQDSQQALAGGHLIVLDAMMDGAVINPDAFIVAGKAASTTTTSK